MESEKVTRKTRIDGRVRDAGWIIKPFKETDDTSKHKLHAIEELPTNNGPADYGLFEAGQPLGVVEAKKVTVGANVLTQAERYSKGYTKSPFNFDGYRVPFLYSTNGEIIHFHDVRRPLNASRQIAKFHTPSALREMLDEEGNILSRISIYVGAVTSNSDRPIGNDAKRRKRKLR